MKNCANRTDSRPASQDIRNGDFRIWHIPQVPGKGFYFPVTTPRQGKIVLGILAQYDLFLLHNRHRVDYANAAGLEVMEDGEWVEWENENGDDIDSIPIDELS